ncbi:unnamed protein product [Plutella xylostella]|uniref:(diamondback moth) hypothetical protein n=1 Tax=Plutella xylostella TaxID=51655 RepID=A0A8S4GCX9_PLUXY|nr:unnamed protein product [Plutella xylostella]
MEVRTSDGSRSSVESEPISRRRSNGDHARQSPRRRTDQKSEGAEGSLMTTTQRGRDDDVADGVVVTIVLIVKSTMWYIGGRKAVDCLLNGVEDRAVRVGAQAARFREPEDLLKYFKTVKTETARDVGNKPGQDRRLPSQHQSNNREFAEANKTNAPTSFTCHNCNEFSHKTLLPPSFPLASGSWCVTQPVARYDGSTVVLPLTEPGFINGHDVHVIAEHSGYELVMTDLKKAFDTVSVPILVQRLEDIGIRGIPLQLLQDYLTNRTQRVKIVNQNSDLINISYGVPQGSILGPVAAAPQAYQLCSAANQKMAALLLADGAQAYQSSAPGHARGGLIPAGSFNFPKIVGLATRKFVSSFLESPIADESVDRPQEPPLISDVPTSEVGSPREDCREKQSSRMDENVLKLVLEAQGKNMASLIDAIRQPPRTVILPEFDPDKPEADPRAWCSTADLCLSEDPLHGSALIIVISAALKGCASRWLSQVSFAGMTWQQFKDMFIARYGCAETLAATLIKLQNNRPKENEPLPAYAARMVTALTSRLQNVPTDKIVIASVLSHMAQFEPRLQRLAFTAEINSRDQLQRELQAFSYLKRNASSMHGNGDERIDYKRFKPSIISALRCFHCAHAELVPFRHSGQQPVVKDNIGQTNTTSAVAQSPRRFQRQADPVCFRCGTPGHFASNCHRNVPVTSTGPSPQLGGNGAANSTERRVDVCCVDYPRAELTNNDACSGYHQIPVHPDSVEKTAFVTPEGQWEYLAMPFGLKNATSVFQRAVNSALVVESRHVEQKRVDFAELTDDWLKVEQDKDEEIKKIISDLQNESLSEDIRKTYELSVPRHTLHIDASGKLSGKSDLKEYVFVTIDAFTKYVLLFHSKNIDTNSSINALKSAITLFGPPRRVIADQGRCFSSKEFALFCESHCIDLHLIATGSSRANGQVERVMSTLKRMLTSVETRKDRSWQDALGDVQLAMNSTVNRVTKASPLELLIGRVARPLSLMSVHEDEPEINLNEIREQAAQNIESNACYDKERFDRHKANVTKLSVGDFVLIENEERNQTKLDAKFRGPLKIIEVLDGDRYLLKSLNSKRTYKYSHDRVRKIPDQQVPPEFDTVADLSESDNVDCSNDL